MKRISAFVFVLCTGIFSIFAQGEMKPMTESEVNAFKKKMAAEAQKVNTIESDFMQLKHIAAMAGDIASTGKFYYQKNDKVSLDYTTPVKYQIVINGSKIKMVSNGKTNVFDIASNGLMKEMKEVISACMTGNLQAMGSNYKLEYYQDAKEHLVKIFPLSDGAKAIIDEVNIYLEKSDLSVTRMRMVEASKDKKAKDKDYTEYQFSNKKLNADIPASRFSIK
ncbi:MAG: outer membrane lipoprotein carrier protein LolA [Prevotellaceae bacterium]|nr:outer membrane lipoprotein carrier protein LolA [Prevotellaceae bacterium]